MDVLLTDIARYVGRSLELIAILVIVVGMAEALVGVARVGMRSAERREVWLLFAHWLVAGMTIQMAADVVHTSFDPSWTEIGQLATIAVIRTFLAFFLDREVDAKERELRRESSQPGARAGQP